MALKDDNIETITRAYIEMCKEIVRKGLMPVFLEYFDALCDELENTFWMPISGSRSIEEQLLIYNKGRTQESIAKGEAIVTRARPGFSPHNWGCATDWVEYKPHFLTGEIWTKSDWSFYGAAVRKVGLTWGGDFKTFLDRPHCELPLKVSWKEIGQIYMTDGKQGAVQAIMRQALFFNGGEF